MTLSVPVFAQALVLGAASLQAGAGWRGLAYGGHAPISFGEDPEPSLAVLSQPSVGLRLKRSKQQLSFVYQQTATYSRPNEQALDRPIMLHGGQLSYFAEPPRLELNAQIKGLMGEVDYSNSERLFETTQVTALRADVVQVGIIEGRFELEYETTRRLKLLIGAHAERIEPTDDTPDEVLPESTSLSLYPGFEYKLSPTTLATLTLNTNYYETSIGEESVTLGPLVGIESKLSPQTELEVAGGFLYVRRLQVINEETEGDDFGPDALVGIKTEAYRKHGFRIYLEATATTSFFFDPITGEVVPRAGGELQGLLTAGRNWRFTPLVVFYTRLNEPEPREQDARVAYETLLRVELPFSYRLTRATDFLFGGQMLGRGPHLSEGLKLGDQMELWAFVGMRFTVASRQDDSGWVH